MKYYLWPHGDKERLCNCLKKSKVDLGRETRYQKVMSAGDVAYFYLTPKIGIVAFATLAGKPYEIEPAEVIEPAFPLAVNLEDIHYITPPIKCHGRQGIFQGVTALAEPPQLLDETTVIDERADESES